MNDKPKNENTIVAMRDMLFDSMRALKKGATAEEIELAKARNELAQTIINSAKVEVDAMRVAGGSGSGFIPLSAPLPTGSSKTMTGKLIHKPGVLEHRIDG